ncbi:MAG TPA: hypothetical protein VFS00_30280, partial [Polyangiaceae bacterium]|nr:hypothetical protein [Polyangiaceae bacterium]
MTPIWRASAFVLTCRSPCISTISGLPRSSCITRVLITWCSGTPSWRADSSVPPCSTYSYTCSVNATPRWRRNCVAGVSLTWAFFLAMASSRRPPRRATVAAPGPCRRGIAEGRRPVLRPARARRALDGRPVAERSGRSATRLGGALGR